MAQGHGWHEDDFITFLLSLKLPAITKDMPLKNSIEEEKKRFKNNYTKMINRRGYRRFSEDFYVKLSDALMDIISNFNFLIRIVEAYDNADNALAQAFFDQMMQELFPHLLKTDLYCPFRPTKLYRIRESKDKELKKPQEMFHISYRYRHLISNERYSLAGHPCLYLSSMLHIAWQECGYPHRFYYSEFDYQESSNIRNQWLYITFLSPHWIATNWFVAINPPEDKYIKIAIDYMLSYPLIFACSIVNANGHSAFKPEYVIPQMLTQWIYRNNDKIKGIKYFSCHKNEEDMRYNGFNVVLPAKNCDTRGYSKDLAEKFRVSKPITHAASISDDKAAVVEKCKDEMLLATGVLPRIASEALFELYKVADLLDKAIKNWENTEMPLILSMLSAAISLGEFLLKENKKDIIAEQSKKDTLSSDTFLQNLNIYDAFYDRFKAEVLEIAISYRNDLSMFSLPTVTEYFKI